MNDRVCPVWIGYLLANPLRKLYENPKKIIGHYIKPGMTVLDVGSAMGFFSIPIARMVGAEGKTIAVDLQPKMIESLKKRAARAKLQQNIETRICESDNLCIDDLENKIDFALAYHVVHETPDALQFYKQIFGSLKSNGKFFVAEPKGHIDSNKFNQSVSLAREAGFEVIDHPKIRFGHSVLFQKK
jgi:ubiquinone/menaquinone biosynthesis C-methylase UbiE